MRFTDHYRKALIEYLLTNSIGVVVSIFMVIWGISNLNFDFRFVTFLLVLLNFYNLIAWFPHKYSYFPAFKIGDEIYSLEDLKKYTIHSIQSTGYIVITKDLEHIFVPFSQNKNLTKINV